MLLVRKMQRADLFSDLGHVCAGQHLEVRVERARVQHAVVLALVLRFVEEDVVLERPILNPRLLRHVRHGALNEKR